MTELVQSVLGQLGVFAEKPARQFLVEMLWRGAGNNRFVEADHAVSQILSFIPGYALERAAPNIINSCLRHFASDSALSCRSLRKYRPRTFGQDPAVLYILVTDQVSGSNVRDASGSHVFTERISFPVNGIP